MSSLLENGRPNKVSYATRSHSLRPSPASCPLSRMSPVLSRRVVALIS